MLLITAMQSARPQQLWAASLLSATIGLVAFALLAGSRMLLATRFGSTIADGADRQASRQPGGGDHRRGRRHRRPRRRAVTAWWAWIELADVAGIVVPRPSSVWEDISSAPGEYVSATVSTL